jgi:hypothetical protein
MRQLIRSWRRGVVLAVALAVIVLVPVTAVGFPGGILFGLAIGAATAVAGFSDSGRHDCLPLFRRREWT